MEVQKRKYKLSQTYPDLTEDPVNTLTYFGIYLKSFIDLEMILPKDYKCAYIYKKIHEILLQTYKYVTFNIKNGVRTLVPIDIVGEAVKDGDISEVNLLLSNIQP